VGGIGNNQNCVFIRRDKCDLHQKQKKTTLPNCLRNSRMVSSLKVPFTVKEKKQRVDN